ncbi:MAG: glycosyltransferase family 2 protein [Planctomycetes bacterium]|nr:glycosyltransferase family 2 protein [Planctomycetota bacterium]
MSEPLRSPLSGRHASIVVLVHNKLAYTRRCLESLLLTDYTPLELIIVDNGSTDGTREYLAAFGARAREAGLDFRLIANEGNVGCSTGRNQGLAAASGEVAVFMDNDTALRQRGWLRSLVAGLFSAEDIGVVGPKLVYPFAPHDIQCAGVGVSPKGRIQFRGRGEARTDSRFSERREVQCLISACFALRTGAARDVGGSEEIYNPVEYEDLDLCYRLREKGWRALYLPEAEVYHFEGVTTTGTPSLPNTYLLIKNGYEFKKRWRPMFSREAGPPEAETCWKKIRTPALGEIGELEIQP